MSQPEITEKEKQVLKLLHDIAAEGAGNVALRRLSAELNTDTKEIVPIVVELIKKDLVRSSGTLDYIEISPAGSHYVKNKLLEVERGESKVNTAISASKRKLIFISHINEDKNVALELKKLLQSLFSNNIDIFVSSDKESIPYGKEWFPPIKENLSRCDIALILCSPLSITKPWINFEAGGSAILNRPTIPLCFGGQKPGELPDPLSHYRGADAESIEDLDGMIKEITRVLEIEYQKLDLIKSEFYRLIKSYGIQGTTNTPSVTAELNSSVIHQGEDIDITGITPYPHSNVNIELFKLGSPDEQKVMMGAATGSDGSFEISQRSDRLSPGHYGVTIELPTGEWTKLSFNLKDRKREIKPKKRWI